MHEVKLRHWNKVIAVNLTGTFLSCASVLPQMMKQGKGSIVTISSVQGLESANEAASVYNASKGGVNLLMKNIANDYGRHNIRCNSVCPGNS